MRILFWCPYINLGGGKRLLRPIVTALAAHPEIETIRLAIPETAVDILPPAHPKIEVVILSATQCRAWLTRDSWHSQPSKLRALRAFVRHQRDKLSINGLLDSLQKNMDAAYVFWPHTVPYYAFDIPVVCMFQDVTLLDYPEIFGGNATEIERANTSKWLHGSKELVVSSWNTAHRIEKHFGIPKERFHLLSYHKIVLDEVKQDQTFHAPSALIEGLPSRYLFYPANITVHKNHEALLIAWSRFARRHELPLVLVGEGVQILKAENQSLPTRNWREDALRGMMKRLNLVEGRDFYAFGYISDEDLVHMMNKATGLIMPTYTEGFGMPVLEAAARGIPVLCSDIPVLHETLAGCSADILWFDPYSIDDILTKTNALLDNYDRYKQSAEAGRNDSRSMWPDTAESYVKVFRSVIQAAAN